MSKPNKIDLLKCKLLGHEFVAGPRYRNAAISGCSKICRRCGFYEVVLDGEEAGLPEKIADDGDQANEKRVNWGESRW